MRRDNLGIARKPLLTRLVVVLCLSAALPGVVQCATAGEAVATRMRERVATLRSEGRYGEAAAVADSLLTHCERDPGCGADDTATARGLRATVRYIAELPPTARRDLARADSLEQFARSARDAGDHGRAVGAARDALAIRRDLFGDRHVETIGTMVFIGEALYGEDDVEAAVEATEEAAALAAASLEFDHRRLGTMAGCGGGARCGPARRSAGRQRECQSQG